MARRLFTSESVTEGHPDKIADQISDGILDALLAQDPRSRVAVETLITTGQVHVAGEVTTQAYADIPAIVRETILNIGYDSSKKGFDGASCGVSVSIGSQSPDIAQGVDSAVELREGSSEHAKPNIMPWSPAPWASSWSSASPERASIAWSTPCAMSGDCEPIDTLTPHDAPSKPFFDESYPMPRIVSRTMAGMSA